MIVAKRTTDGKARFHCPACREGHAVPIDGPRAWGFNGSFERPTFTPSILVSWSEPSDVEGEFDDLSKDKKHVCHSFVTDGVIQYLGDCTHPLAGQSVPLPAIEEAKP
jgi:hypothetical protein